MSSNSSSLVCLTALPLNLICYCLFGLIQLFKKCGTLFSVALLTEVSVKGKLDLCSYVFNFAAF